VNSSIPHEDRFAAHTHERRHSGQPGHSSLAGHTRPEIHTRHLTRVHYEQALSNYRLELRHWRHLMTEREFLLRKVGTLERRLRRSSK
jgi:hypothetical protein